MAPPKAKAAAKSLNFYAVLGTDEAEVKSAASELAARLTSPDAGEFGAETIDGAADNVDTAIVRIHQTVDSLQTLPFFGEKMVWLKNANFLGDSVMGRSNGVIEALDRLAEVLQSGLPANVKFLLSATDIDKRRSFYKTLGKIAEVRVFDEIDTSKSGWEAEAAEACADVAEAEGIKFKREAMEYFVVLTGGSTRSITSEMTKLSLYVGTERAVTLDDVRLLVSQTKSGVVFDLGKAVCRRDIRSALQICDQLLRQGETAIGILLASVIPTVRNLLLARDLLDRHKMRVPDQAFAFISALNRLPESATRHLPRKKDGGLNAYGLAFAAIDAHRFSLAELQAGLEACLEANVQLITSQMEARVVLSRLLVRILTPGLE